MRFVFFLMKCVFVLFIILLKHIKLTYQHFVLKIIYGYEEGCLNINVENLLAKHDEENRSYCWHSLIRIYLSCMRRMLFI